MKIFFVFSLFVLALHGIHSADITIPKSFYDHYWENKDVIVDKDVINKIADEYCKESIPPTSNLFFFSDLALASADRSCEHGSDNKDLSKLLGNDYFAGYTGGTFLRDLLADMPELSTTSDTKELRAHHNVLLRGLARYPVAPEIYPREVEKKIFFKSAKKAGDLIDLALDGKDDKIIETNYDAINHQLFLFGYTQGFLDAWTEHSPYEDSEPYNPFKCEPFLSCKLTNVTLDVLEDYRDAVKLLSNPKTDKWKELNKTVEDVGEYSYEYGYKFWSKLLKDHIIPRGIYEPIYDISARALLLSDAVVLAEMTAYGEDDVKAGRCGLELQAGFYEWNVGYYLAWNCGLDDDECMPKGQYPTLKC